MRYIDVHELTDGDVLNLRRHADGDKDACMMICNECPLATIRTHSYSAHRLNIPCSLTFRMVQANYLLELYHATMHEIECTLLGDRND
jgi:hypothetical protein